MKAQESPPNPLSITQQDLEAFNRFWASLDPFDRQVLEDLIRTAEQNGNIPGRPNFFLPYSTFLLSLLVEEHKAVMRLTRQVQELQASQRSDLK